MQSSFRWEPIARQSPGNPKLTIYRDGVRLGEWSQDEAQKLCTEGLLNYSDHYCREGMAERHPLQSLLRPVVRQGPSIFTRNV